MKMDENIRWKYSYEGDFRPKIDEVLKTLSEFEDLIAEGVFDEYSQIRFFKSFKKLFDGAIKTLKFYFRYQGIFQVSVFEIIKEAFYVEIIENGQTWVDMMFDLNQWEENNYNDLDIKSRLKVKEKYLPEMEELDKFFQKELEINNGNK